MPSPENAIGPETEWVQLQHQALTTYAEKIESCIQQSAWNMLAIVLEARQAYLRRLFSPPVSERNRDFLKQLAESILRQDAQVKARVEEQKNNIARQHLSLDRGRRAVRSYALNN